MRMKRSLKIVLSWLAVLLGFALSVLGFGLLGVVPLTTSFSPPHPKTWLNALALLAFGATPLSACVVAFYNRKLASYLCFVAAPLVSVMVWLTEIELADVIFYRGYSRDQYSPTASAAITFVPLLLLGYFWSIAHRYDWPPIALGIRLSAWTRTVLAVTAGLLFFVLACGISVRVASTWELPGDCGGPPPFSKPYPGHAVFTARVINFNRITGAMAIVQERFGGLPWWNKIVFLKFIHQKGTYFIDGRFEEGIVTRWVVPVLDLKCSGSCPIDVAGVELRLFRDNHWAGVRITGRVLQSTGSGWVPTSAATVIVEGPNGSIMTAADTSGIYDVSGLPEGHCTIHVPNPGLHGACRDFREGTLKSGDVWGCDLLANAPE